MSAVGIEEVKVRVKKVPKWESELWSYISKGDGMHCPLCDTCEMRQDSEWCFSDSKGISNGLYGTHAITGYSSYDSESVVLRCMYEHVFPLHWKPGRIFQLVETLANKYIRKAKQSQPPILTELIRHFEISPSVEIRILPLKAYHGAVWHLDDGWVIHLNAEDKPARQRVTLFHEVFHILAHTRAIPVFKKQGSRKALFNEALADYFAGCILMPEEWVKRTWVEVEDLQQMAETFQVTEVIVWARLRTIGLI